MNIKSLLFIAATGVVLTACHSNAYHLSGTVEGMEDGDTLFLTTDLEQGIPTDTILVSDGQFTYSGEADSVALAMVYSAKRNELNANFFIEPGDIRIKISEEPGTSRVGGTGCNDSWQELMDSVVTIGKRINRIAEHIYGNTVSKEEQEKGMAQMDDLNRHFANVLIQTARKNIKNEFGYFLLTYYPEELIDNATREELIQQLPAEMRQRSAIKSIEQEIAKSKKTAAGAVIPDFTQPGPDGTPVSIKAEVAKNRLTIIDFWASWCGPCRHDMPQVVALYQQYQGKGLGIVGISLDQDGNAWKKAISDLKMTWTQMSDLKGWDNAAAKQFNITSIPHTVIVDQKGTILARGLRGQELAQFVAKKLKR